MTIDEMRAVMADCRFEGYEFLVTQSPTTKAIYLQAEYWERDTTSPGPESVRQLTRRWFLSPEMTRSEIVSTAFKCVITSMEHKTREWFTYKGKAIYHPHHDVDKLLEICETTDERPDALTHSYSDLGGYEKL